MKSYAEFKHFAPGAWMEHGVGRRVLQHFSRSFTINWYRLAVVAMTTFAITMDLAFPPVRVAIGHGSEVYAGHADVPFSIADAIHVDFTILAVELAVIIAAAVIGWRLGAPASPKRESAGKMVH